VRESLRITPLDFRSALVKALEIILILLRSCQVSNLIAYLNLVLLVTYLVKYRIRCREAYIRKADYISIQGTKSNKHLVTSLVTALVLLSKIN
jgi:hypothetical protein